MAKANGNIFQTEDSLLHYLKDVAATRPLPAREEAVLASRIKKGDREARDTLVEANLRFVISVAQEYQNRGVPLEDLISAGNMGLITAAERFDETREVKFISYAVWWIRQAILQTLSEDSRIVRMPTNRAALLRQISLYTRSRQQEDVGDPPEEEIAEKLGVTVGLVVDTLVGNQQTLSLDATFRCDSEHIQEEPSLMDLMADENQESPETEFMRNSLKEDMEGVLESLEKPEQEVLRLYFGMDGTPEMTLQAIGSEFGLTRERIRQIKEKALNKLRNPKRMEKLIPYVEEI